MQADFARFRAWADGHLGLTVVHVQTDSEERPSAEARLPRSASLPSAEAGPALEKAQLRAWCVLLFSLLLSSLVIHKSMSLKYEPSSELRPAAPYTLNPEP